MCWLSLPVEAVVNTRSSHRRRSAPRRSRRALVSHANVEPLSASSSTRCAPVTSGGQVWVLTVPGASMAAASTAARARSGMWMRILKAGFALAGGVAGKRVGFLCVKRLQRQRARSLPHGIVQDGGQYVDHDQAGGFAAESARSDGPPLERCRHGEPQIAELPSPVAVVDPLRRCLVVCRKARRTS